MGTPSNPYTNILSPFSRNSILGLKKIIENKIDIYDIPISELTEQYIDYLKKMEELKKYAKVNEGIDAFMNNLYYPCLIPNIRLLMMWHIQKLNYNHPSSVLV